MNTSQKHFRIAHILLSEILTLIPIEDYGTLNKKFKLEEKKK